MLPMQQTCIIWYWTTGFGQPHLVYADIRAGYKQQVASDIKAG